MYKLTLLFALVACGLPEKNQCRSSADCLNGEQCTGSMCMPNSNPTLFGDWFGGLPGETMLDNDGCHLDADGSFAMLHANEVTGSPEQNSRLDPDEDYCTLPGTQGTYTVTHAGGLDAVPGDVIAGGTYLDGTIVSLDQHSAVIMAASGSTRTFFRIDPPRLVASCINP